MTLETGVKELAEAVGADVKALDAGKVNSSDPRLSDAREWTAASVTREEAEAGNSLIRRAWSAQRVRQAIAAWYLTVSTGFTRTLLGRSTAAQVRGDLGLGTAATRDVGTGDGDLMEKGAFGVGSTTVGTTIYVTNKTPSGIYSFEEGSTGLPPQVDPNGAVGLIFNWGNRHQWGLFGKVQDNRLFLRRYVSSQNDNDVVELHTTGNIRSTAGQSTSFPMSQKAVTEAINARGFADASGILTVTSGALSNDMSAFLSLKTKAEIIAWLAD